VAVSTGTARVGSAPARRIAIPSWRDPRLLVGVLLVLAAVVAGARVVAAADRTVPVYAAAQALTPGEPVGPEQLDVVRLRLDGGAGAGAYVSAEEPPAGGLVALRGVGPGELVPAVALGPADSLDVRPVGVPVQGALPSGLVEGALVDVWVTAVDLATPGALLEPRRVVEAAPVAEVDADTGALGSAATTTVQVLVGTGALPDVLAALAADARVHLVLTPGGGSGDDAAGASAGAAAGAAPAAGAGRSGAPQAPPSGQPTSARTSASTSEPPSAPSEVEPSAPAPSAPGPSAPAPSTPAPSTPAPGPASGSGDGTSGAAAAEEAPAPAAEQAPAPAAPTAADDPVGAGGSGG